MPVGDKCWVEYSEALRKKMFQRGIFELRVPMEDIHYETGTTVPFHELRNPGYWNACRDARRDWDTFQKYGVELVFEVEPDGHVHFVTFRLDSSRRESLERMLQRRTDQSAGYSGQLQYEAPHSES